VYWGCRIESGQRGISTAGRSTSAQGQAPETRPLPRRAGWCAAGEKCPPLAAIRLAVVGSSESRKAGNQTHDHIQPIMRYIAALHLLQLRPGCAPKHPPTILRTSTVAMACWGAGKVCSSAGVIARQVWGGEVGCTYQAVLHDSRCVPRHHPSVVVHLNPQGVVKVEDAHARLLLPMQRPAASSAAALARWKYAACPLARLSTVGCAPAVPAATMLLDGRGPLAARTPQRQRGAGCGCFFCCCDELLVGPSSSRRAAMRLQQGGCAHSQQVDEHGNMGAA
jgi:hypothetical protein